MVGIGVYLTEGARIFLSSLKRRSSFKKYEGNAEQICQQVVKDCWNGRYFQTSTGNFAQFWTRDFGWTVSSLLKLKYANEVQQTLRYALNRFRKYNKITTTITPAGKAYDFPIEAVDSLPWFIHAIKVSKFSYHTYRVFINKEINKFYKNFIDHNTGLIKPSLHVSSMKDFAKRKSSCYDNCMVAMLAKDLKGMKLDNPFNKFDYEELIKRHFWNGHYFYDDLAQGSYVSGDANLFPFIIGIISDKEMMQKAISKVQSVGLDQPFPLKYTASREGINFISQEAFLRNYESDSVWTHMGPLFIKLVQQVNLDKAKEYKEKYAQVIEKNQNYLEVFLPNEKPWSSPFVYCDVGMIWAANYLTL